MTVTHDEEYVGYRIHVVAGVPGDFPGFFARAEIWEPTEGSLVSHFVELLDWALKGRPSGSPDDDEGAQGWLAWRAYHRARGAILLGRVDEVNRTRNLLSSNHQFAERSDDYLRRIVLHSLRRVYEHEPAQRGRAIFDDIGVALMENVDPKRVEYILERLDGDGIIKSYAMGHEAGARLYMPTPEGMRLADELTDETKAPGLLVEQTVAEVERALSRHAPDLVQRLLAMSLKVAEARELTHIDVGEIAQSCDLVLQDFLDLPALWQDITETKPAKDKTKERLSLILKHKVPSDTEQELVKALANYLFGWFGPLDKFINKHRHPTEQSARRHAKRILLYTYLLIADLIELLDV